MNVIHTLKLPNGSMFSFVKLILPFVTYGMFKVKTSCIIGNTNHNQL